MSERGRAHFTEPAVISTRGLVNRIVPVGVRESRLAGAVRVLEAEPAGETDERCDLVRRLSEQEIATNRRVVQRGILAAIVENRLTGDRPPIRPGDSDLFAEVITEPAERPRRGRIVVVVVLVVHAEADEGLP